jgi:hypothetical protein
MLAHGMLGGSKMAKYATTLYAKVVDGLVELARDQWGMKKLMQHIEGLLAPFPAGDNDESAEEDEGIALVDEPAPRIQAGACTCCAVAQACFRVFAFRLCMCIYANDSVRNACFLWRCA